MEALASRITGFCIRNHLAEQDDEPWLRYGIEKRISTFINIIPFILLAVYLTNLPAALSFLFAFRALRKSSSGYHAKTALGCACSSLLFEMLFLGGLYQHLSSRSFFWVNLICGFIVLFLAPYNHPNMHFSKDEMLALKQRARRSVTVLILLSLASNFVGFPSIAMGITTGIAMAASLLCLAYTIDWRISK